jgi:uncharacterized Zn-binding protein involved in type VI secretion
MALMSVHRFGDFDITHSCFSSRANIGGSSNVFVNNKGAHRQGDSWASHNCGPSSHSGICARGSNTVYVNNKQLARMTDSISCGSTCGFGSGNVYSG